MDLAEATRQYQIALEHDRTVRDRSFDLLSFEDDREDARLGLAEAEGLLYGAWMEAAWQ